MSQRFGLWLTIKSKGPPPPPTNPITQKSIQCLKFFEFIYKGDGNDEEPDALQN